MQSNGPLGSSWRLWAIICLAVGSTGNDLIIVTPYKILPHLRAFTFELSRGDRDALWAVLSGSSYKGASIISLGPRYASG